MAILSHGDLRLWLAGPKASASKPMPDGAIPSPGGRSRFVLNFDDLESVISKLTGDDVSFRNDTMQGPGGQNESLQRPFR